MELVFNEATIRTKTKQTKKNEDNGIWLSFAKVLWFCQRSSTNKQIFPEPIECIMLIYEYRFH